MEFYCDPGNLKMESLFEFIENAYNKKKIFEIFSLFEILNKNTWNTREFFYKI